VPYGNSINFVMTRALWNGRKVWKKFWITEWRRRRRRW